MFTVAVFALGFLAFPFAVLALLWLGHKLSPMSDAQRPEHRQPEARNWQRGPSA